MNEARRANTIALVALESLRDVKLYTRNLSLRIANSANDLIELGFNKSAVDSITCRNAFVIHIDKHIFAVQLHGDLGEAIEYIRRFFDTAVTGCSINIYVDWMLSKGGSEPQRTRKYIKYTFGILEIGEYDFAVSELDMLKFRNLAYALKVPN
jgi:hypothetical protein